MMKMMYSLSTGRPATASLRRAPVLRAENLLHLFGELLLRRDQLALQLVRHLGVLVARLVLALHVAQIPAQPRELLLHLRQLLFALGEVAIEDLGLAPDVVALFLQLEQPPLQVQPRLLERGGFAELAQHEQQDDRAEGAADRVEERHAEDFEIARAAPFHGQSFAGIRNAPLVRRASVQKAPVPPGRLPSASGSRWPGSGWDTCPARARTA